jgi:hypothetical protein
MNVAFGAKSHKEMLWASFEHINNTPNPKYYYVNIEKKAVPFLPSIGSTWLFSSGGAGAPDQNVRRMYLSGDDIYADKRKTIGPSNILRVKPWGREPNNAISNTNVISINNGVLARLYDGDVRKNYIMTGTTWSSSSGVGTPLGTSELANTTMETFFQGSNCLDCHRGSSLSQPGAYPSMLGTINGGGVSHIYGATNPLPFR